MLEGKKKEKKLVLKAGYDTREIRNTLLYWLEEFLRLHDGTIKLVGNFCCNDTYYDTEEDELLNEGGSLKTREAVDCAGGTKRSLVMRRKTKNPKKMKVTLWDELDLPTTVKVRDNKNIEEMFKPLETFFKDFDFSSLKKEPVLMCNTVRTTYNITKKDKSISLYFDHVLYKVGKVEAEDYLVKLKMKSEDSAEDVEEIYGLLDKEFPEYKLIDSSRYERALERIKEESKE